MRPPTTHTARPQEHAPHTGIFALFAMRGIIMGWKSAPRVGASHGPTERPFMSSFFKDLREFIWLHRQGFRAAEYIRGNDRISMHACGWRANGSGRMKSAHDAVAYLEGAAPEQWRQIYCGMTPFLVSDRGNVRLIDGSEPKMLLANGRYQIAYKPEDPHPARRSRRGGMAHKKRVYRSVLVAMAFLDFKKGDEEHEVHHVNGYRTDDRLVNLMVLTHEEHTRIHNMGPCGLTAPVDEAIEKANLLAETKPMGKLKLRRMKKRALDVALAEPKNLPAAAAEQAGRTEAEKSNGAQQSEPAASSNDAHQTAAAEAQQKPDRAAITEANAPAGTFAFAPLPVLDETGTFTTPEAPEVAAAKQAEKDAREAERKAAEQRAAAEAAALAQIPARGNHKADEKSTLQAATEEGLAEIGEKLEGAQIRSGAQAQESLNNGSASKSSRRRASRKRAEARRAEAREKAAEEKQADAKTTAVVEQTETEQVEAPIAEPDANDVAVKQLQGAERPEAIEQPMPTEAEQTQPHKAAQPERTPDAQPKASAVPSNENTSSQAEPKPKPKPTTEPQTNMRDETPAPKSKLEPAKKDQHPKSQADAPTDWTTARDELARETKTYLKAARKLAKHDDATDKQFSAIAKPVYKAFKPFLACNDAVVVFDACLACIRLIAKDAEIAKKHGVQSLPKSTHSLVGTFQKSLKTSVRKLMHEDEIVAECTEELLRDEAGKPAYKALGTNPLRHCLNIVDSKKRTKERQEAHETDQHPTAKKSDAPNDEPKGPSENETSAPEAKSKRHAKDTTAVEAPKLKAKPAPAHEPEVEAEAPAENLREGNAPSTKRRNTRRRNRTKRAKEIMEAKD